MTRAVSIHIGVNRPLRHSPGDPLRDSETAAWRMAGIAERAGYDALLVLRGTEATLPAAHDALAGAARGMRAGDILFVSFSGHGTQVRDLAIGPGADPDERDGWDEAWCLSDGLLVDDKLAGYWRLFDPGVRILVVSESCFAGGMDRIGNKCAGQSRDATGGSLPEAAVDRAAAGDAGGAGSKPAPCIVQPRKDSSGIRASLLLLAACGEGQRTHDGVFTQHLLAVWNDGAFHGSYCELYREVAKACAQEPRIRMLGAPDPAFPMERAFHLDRHAPRLRPGYR
jgi:hypothetical protein